MRNRTILCFDFDGVIVDNTYQGFKKINTILSELTIPPVSIEFLRSNWGKKFEDLMAIVCEQQGAGAQELALFKKRDKGFHIGSKLDMNLVKVLARLSKVGYLTAIVTSRDRFDLERYAEELGLNLDMFNYVQTIDDYPYHKPSGKVFKPLVEWAYQEHGYPAENIVYFGDTLAYDYRAVTNIRSMGYPLKFVGVCSGVNTYDDFLTAGLAETEIIPSHDTLSFYLNRLIQVKVK